MTKEDLVPGMVVRLTTGPGTYKTTKWSALVRIVSVNRVHDEVSGIQYKTLAVRNKDCPTHFKFRKTNTILSMQQGFDDWWVVFNGKILG